MYFIRLYLIKYQGIHGMILHVMNQSKDVDSRVATASTIASNKVLTICHNEYPTIAQFPIVIQKLLIPEIMAVEERIAAGKETPYDLAEQDLRCKCQFSRSYLLPCRHIFHLDYILTVLTPDRWQCYVDMFEDGGLEVYEKIGVVDVEEQLAAVTDGEKVSSLLELREIHEQLHHQLYAVHEILEERQMSEEERREVVIAWVDHVRGTVAPLANVGIDSCVATGGCALAITGYRRHSSGA